jgi:hypothetical protein
MINSEDIVSYIEEYKKEVIRAVPTYITGNPHCLSCNKLLNNNVNALTVEHYKRLASKNHCTSWLLLSVKFYCSELCKLACEI